MESSEENYIRNSYFGVLLVLIIIAALIAMSVGARTWQTRQTELLLTGPARGADVMFEQRKMIMRDAIAVTKDIANSMSPGSYLRGLSMWENAMFKETPADSAAWLVDMQKAERQELSKVFFANDIDINEIKSIKEKMKKVSPQLSDSETRTLNVLVDNISVMAVVQDSTAVAISQKMYELGNGTALLKKFGFKMAKFKLDFYSM